MKPEPLLWHQLSKVMGPFWHAQRHEEASGAKGVPDASFGMFGVNGWIELKTIEGWPKNPNKIVEIKHFTAEQKLWMLMRGRAGGNTWLFLKVENDYLLFDHAGSQEVGKLDKAMLLACSNSHWAGMPKASELVRILAPEGEAVVIKAEEERRAKNKLQGLF